MNETLTIRLGEKLAHALHAEARQTGLAKGEITRQALESRLKSGGKLTVMKRYIGVMRGHFRFGHEQILPAAVARKTGMKNILDAGPLIALLNSQEEHHRWACEILERLGPPFYSCPEAIAEAAAMTGQPAAIVEMIRAEEIILAFNLSEQTAGVLALLKKYADRDMDLADACIVRMTELMRDSGVVTLDRSDFTVYRRNGRDLIPMIAPPVN